MAISLEQMNKIVLPQFGIKSSKELDQKAIDQLMASNPAIAARVGLYNKILEGRPLMAAKGGYIFTPEDANNPKAISEMKDNPEFAEFTIDQQAATANKMQQRFAQPQDRMQRQPARGYATGGETTPNFLPGQPMPAPTNPNPNIDAGFYDSPEWKEFSSGPAVGPGTMDMYESPYFGTRGSGSIGRAEDRAYENYLKRSGQEQQRTQQEKLQKLAADQASMLANVYSDPSKVATPSAVATTPITPEQIIAETTGDVAATAPAVTEPTASTVQQVTTPTTQTPQGVMQAATAAPDVKTAVEGMAPAQGTVSTEAQAVGQTATTTAVSDLNAAQGTATLMTNPVQRSIQTGELVSGAANAATASAFNEQIQAATATPTAQATVQGQLNSLMADFEGGATPAWAAGAMRAATAAMAARGLGASSIAGQAIVQATMESALPIAQADAQVTAQFEAQNLSNRQQRAMLAAQQRATFMGMEFDQAFQARVQNSARIGDIANMNFTAEQQIALENSRAVNTMNMANLSNRQAMVMAEAAALSQLDISNLNNRQQAAVQNAQNFMQMDMQNLGNSQQTTMFKQQQILQSLFTDQAATNAANQFNATSENQTQQFFASLSNQSQQFNATQANAMEQFDAEQVNTIRRFNAEVENQRDQFNAANRLVIAQANTKWRQSIATLDTAAQNEANMEYAKSINNLTDTAIDQLWQRERDLMGFAYSAAEAASERALKVALQEMSDNAKERLQDDIGRGKFLGTILDGVVGSFFGTRKK